MPQYEYRCGRCGTVHTARRQVDDRATPLACPCGGAAAKILSRPRVVQNLSASRDTLQSFGQNLRVEAGAGTLGELVRRKERERGASRAAALEE